MDVFGSVEQQAVVALLVAQVVEALKKAEWFPWLEAHHTRALRVINATTAALASAGVVWAWSPDVPGRLVVDGLTWANVWSLVGVWVTQIGLQQGAYTGLIQRARGASDAIRARQVLVVDRGAPRDEVERRAVEAVQRAVRESYDAAAETSTPPGGLNRVD